MKTLKTATTKLCIEKSLKVGDNTILSEGTECYILYKCSKSAAFWMKGVVKSFAEQSLEFISSNGVNKRFFYRNIVDCSDKQPGALIHGFYVPSKEELSKFLEDKKS